jgi:hypothetical protein
MLHEFHDSVIYISVQGNTFMYKRAYRAVEVKEKKFGKVNFQIINAVKISLLQGSS